MQKRCSCYSEAWLWWLKNETRKWKRKTQGEWRLGKKVGACYGWKFVEKVTLHFNLMEGSHISYKKMTCMLQSGITNWWSQFILDRPAYTYYKDRFERGAHSCDWLWDWIDIIGIIKYFCKMVFFDKERCSNIPNFSRLLAMYI